MRQLMLFAMLSLAAVPALADSTSGTVIAFDRVARIIVLDDKSIWSLETLAVIPEGIEAGVKVVIDYRSNGDNGWGVINSLTIAK